MNIVTIIVASVPISGPDKTTRLSADECFRDVVKMYMTLNGGKERFQRKIDSPRVWKEKWLISSNHSFS